MNQHAIMEFVRTLAGLDDRSYLFSIVAYHTAPTIDGKKPSTLVNLTQKNRDLYRLWKLHKDEISKSLALSFFELRETEESISVLFYKPIVLETYLRKEKNMSLLRTFGYTKDMPMADLLEKLKQGFSFGCPHEIGIFLGIPVKDVMSFISNKGKACLECRYWKVYHNPQRAKCIFDSYDHAKLKIAAAISEAVRLDKTLIPHLTLLSLNQG